MQFVAILLEDASSAISFQWHWLSFGLWIGLMMTLVHAITSSSTATVVSELMWTHCSHIATSGLATLSLLVRAHWEIWLAGGRCRCCPFWYDPSRIAQDRYTKKREYTKNQTTVHICCRANFCKKIFWQHKQRATKRGLICQMTGDGVPRNHFICQALHHSPQYVNIGRFRILEVPLLQRIRVIKSVVQSLGEH